MFRQQKPDTELVRIGASGVERPDMMLQSVEPQSVDIEEYSDYLYTTFQSYKRVRFMLHDITVSMQGGKIDPSRGGVYEQAKQLMAGLTSADLDSMRYLPKFNLVASALRIYEKRVDLKFAMYDWYNTPDMFNVLTMDKNTVLEEEVKQEMRQIYPGISDEDINAAVSQAVGYGYLLMIQQEKAAHADAVRDKYGKPTNESIAPGGDVAVLAPLDVFKVLEQYPYYPHNMSALFLGIPIKGKGHLMDLVDPGKPFDHLEMMNKMMEARKRAETEGLAAFGGQQVKTLLDIGENFS
jgi:hypothetical protein